MVNLFKLSAVVGCFWLFVVLNSFFIWNSYEYVIRIFASFLMILVTLFFYQKKSLKVTILSLLIGIAIIFFFFWLTLRMDISYVNHFMRANMFLPLILVLFWPREAVCDIYILFKKVIVFFAFGSICVSFLYILGLETFIPHYELAPQSALHERNGYVYYVYGCFVIIHNMFSSILPRANGMLQEPGHFAIILGFVYLVERLLRNKPSLIVVICGILTFSPNFVIIFLIAEFYNASVQKKILKTVGYFVLFLLCLAIIFFFLPKNLQEQLYYLVYERNMESVIDALLYSGSLTEALNERINQSGMRYFNSLKVDEMWFGASIHDDSIILSDYRGLIMQIGIIGLLLLVISVLSILYRVSFSAKISLICIISLVLLHRSWMFYAPYLFFILYMSVIVSRNVEYLQNSRK